MNMSESLSNFLLSVGCALALALLSLFPLIF